MSPFHLSVFIYGLGCLFLSLKIDLWSAYACSTVHDLGRCNQTLPSSGPTGCSHITIVVCCSEFFLVYSLTDKRHAYGNKYCHTDKT